MVSIFRLVWLTRRWKPTTSSLLRAPYWRDSRGARPAAWRDFPHAYANSSRDDRFDDRILDSRLHEPLTSSAPDQRCIGRALVRKPIRLSLQSHSQVSATRSPPCWSHFPWYNENRCRMISDACSGTKFENEHLNSYLGLDSVTSCANRVFDILPREPP